jgi:uncharacterized lipoprotein YajG
MYKRLLRSAVKEARTSIIHELIRNKEIPKPAGTTIDYDGIYQAHRDKIDDVLRRVLDDILLSE